MMRILVGLAPFVAGLLFGVGLLVSGMTRPVKVQGFLDIGGVWDPSLALVMGGAIAVALPVFQWSIRRGAAARVHGSIDVRLIIGSVMFGIGWGLSGYCPGPAIVMAGAGSHEALLYVASMGVGMLIGNRLGEPGAGAAS